MLNAQKESGPNGRARLLEAAQQLFCKLGLSEVTVAQILDHSGVKAPTLYHHFDGKEGLYVAWIGEALRRIESKLSALDRQEGPEAFLRGVRQVLLANTSMDVVQVLRDRRWLSGDESLDLIDKALDSCVFRPIGAGVCDYAKSNGRDLSKEEFGQVFVHLLSLDRPKYRRASSMESLDRDLVIRLFLSGTASPVSAGMGEVPADGLESSRANAR
ncbi:MAG: TetR/AcrR family transcriptional regulator [Armatimonadetes bacterium]|nr:TetR/AcrR family transcriptional regulator [Armatimonadota bacterium]